MDPVTQENIALPQAHPTSIEQPKQNNFLVILLSVLLLLSVSIAAFFAYQTQTLVKELTLLKSSPTPVSSTEPTLDPTADWKTYTNTSSNYSIKYPSNWKIENQSAGSMGTIVPDARYIQIGYGNAVSGVLGIEELQIIPPSEEANLNSTKVVGNLTLRCNGQFTSDTKTWCWIKVPNMDKYLNIQVFKNTNEEMNGLLDQILSTFKFSESDSTANWKTYTNNEFGFQMKYPPVWKLEVDKNVATNGNREFRFKTEKNEYVSGVIFDGPTGYIQKLEDWEKKLDIRNGDTLFISYTDNMGPGSKGGNVDLEIFNIFASTFQITN